jgi:hypothetical protein
MLLRLKMNNSHVVITSVALCQFFRLPFYHFIFLEKTTETVEKHNESTPSINYITVKFITRGTDWRRKKALPAQ